MTLHFLFCIIRYTPTWTFPHTQNTFSNLSLFYFTCIRTLLHSFPIIFLLTLFYSSLCIVPARHAPNRTPNFTASFPNDFFSCFSSSAHFPHDMMSIVMITSSSKRQDQTLSTSIALSLASLPFASILKPEMPMTHLLIPFTHTRASSCSHCIYRINCVGYLPTRLVAYAVSYLISLLHHTSPQASNVFVASSSSLAAILNAFLTTAHHAHNIHTCSLSRPPVHSASVFSTAVSIRYIFASVLLYSYSTYKSNTILLHLDCNVNTLR